MDDDVWNDEDESSNQNSSKDRFEKDLEKLQQIHDNEGYKAGIVEGQSRSAQKGFDEGYQKGAISGLSRLNLDEAERAQVENLVDEGWKLSEVAGKRLLSKEDFEEYQRKCKSINESIRQTRQPPD